MGLCFKIQWSKSLQQKTLPSGLCLKSRVANLSIPQLYPKNINCHDHFNHYSKSCSCWCENPVQHNTTYHRENIDYTGNRTLTYSVKLNFKIIFKLIFNAIVLTPPLTVVFMALRDCMSWNNCSKWGGCNRRRVGRFSRGGGGSTDGVSPTSRLFCIRDAPTDMYTNCKHKVKLKLPRIKSNITHWDENYEAAYKGCSFHY